ncbi:MAG: hypothetical protein U9P12_01510, partial [Verrucomicrobiota bacterium]|nr:hypothetical protein [Verrucomicrobiota bacterium]
MSRFGIVPRALMQQRFTRTKRGKAFFAEMDSARTAHRFLARDLGRIILWQNNPPIPGERENDFATQLFCP